ncbi:MAG TPA: tyrosine--tRNA ligase [Puia sp.]|nr:tyrosine--tRNA ligase [Puia sp.]
MTTINLIDELEWRGMIQDIMPGTKEQLSREMTTGYIGFDPTSDSLHIGSLVPILLLMQLQKAGHKPIALLGGATGMVGDPSGKIEERNLLDETTLNRNTQSIKNQLGKFLDFGIELKNHAEMVNNYEWFGKMSFLDFIRQTGKYIPVNYMLAKDSVRKRLEGETGMSFTEFTYQLVQGFDFYWLFTNKNCKLQMGGSDQWGNITTGTELIRRKTRKEAFAFTCPLLTKADGGKFGKTEKGNIWLDPDKTSPFQFYQFWLNASDEDAEKWIKIFTFLPKNEIEALAAEHQKNPGTRELQKILAKEVTVLVHGKEGYQKAIDTTEKLFKEQSDSVESLTKKELESLEGVVRFPFSLQRVQAGLDVVSFLAETGCFSSKGEARKMIQNGGVSINRQKVDDTSFQVSGSNLLFDRYILVQKGRKTYFLVDTN